MKQFLCLLCVLLLTTGCNNTNNSKEDTIDVYALRGPSVLTVAQFLEGNTYVDGKKIEVRILDSPQQIQAAIIKKEADIALLPLISAANLYNKQIDYKLLGCSVWGSIYLIGRVDSIQKFGNESVYMFGKETTPSILAENYFHKNGFPSGITKYNYSVESPQELTGLLLSRRANAAILSEPFISVALRQDTSLSVIADLNQLNGEEGFPQTAIVINPAMQKYTDTLTTLFEEAALATTQHPKDVIHIIEKSRTFGVGTITEESIKRCKIDFKSSREAKQGFIQYLNTILNLNPKSVGEKLPDEGFYIYAE